MFAKLSLFVACTALGCAATPQPIANTTVTSAPVAPPPSVPAPASAPAPAPAAASTPLPSPPEEDDDDCLDPSELSFWMPGIIEHAQERQKERERDAKAEAEQARRAATKATAKKR